MARKRLYKHSYALGYNTRDNPTSVPFASAQIMENILPNDPNCIPRNGSGKWGTPEGAWNGGGTVLHVFAYSSTAHPTLICISQNGDTTSIYTKDKDTGTPIALIYQSDDLDLSSPDTSWARVGSDVYLSNGVDATYILEAQSDGTFYFRNANIQRPVPSPNPNITEDVIPGGDITEGKYVAFAVTYVRRTDSDGDGNGGLDVNGDPQRQEFNVGTDVFHPGVLESVEIAFDPNTPFGSGERVAGQVFSGSQQFFIQGNNLDQLDPQVTHARFYRTLEFDSIEEALAASMRWSIDIPVSGPNSEIGGFNEVSYTENKSNETMAGNFNFSLNIGLDQMPAGRTMKFHNGRLWVGGVADDLQEVRGRYFYSVPPQDADYPQKWYSMFLRGQSSFTIGESTGNPVEITGWKDTDQEDDEFAQIVDVSRNDIIFINSKSVWFLPDGDPETFQPELIDRENGTLFNHSIVHIGDGLYYLSNNGPVMIEGRHVRFLNDHTAGEVWPEVYDGTIGYFYSVADPRLVKGYYARENWILADNDKIVCHYMPHKKTGYGPWQFKAAAGIEIKMGIGAVFNDTELVVYPYNSPNTQFYHVLDPTLENDDGFDFTLRCKGKAQYMSEKDREMFGEAASLIMFTEFTDEGDLLLILTSDYCRVKTVWTYDQRPEDHLLQAGGLLNKFRLNIFQPIIEGFLGQHFEVEWVKTHKTPYRFINKGWTLENIIRNKSVEYISQDYQFNKQGDIIETGTSPYDIIESGASAIEVTEGGTG